MRRAIPGYEGMYEVSDRGEIFSLDRIGCAGRRLKGKRLRLLAHPAGYLVVNLYREASVKKTLVHRLVMLAFAGEPPEGKPLCCHINGDPTDNCWDNLYWGSQKENLADMIRHGKSTRGERDSQAKLTEEDVRLVRDSSFSGVRLAKILGVAPTTISQIRNRKTWRHLK